MLFVFSMSCIQKKPTQDIHAKQTNLDKETESKIFLKYAVEIKDAFQLYLLESKNDLNSPLSLEMKEIATNITSQSDSEIGEKLESKETKNLNNDLIKVSNIKKDSKEEGSHKKVIGLTGGSIILALGISAISSANKEKQSEIAQDHLLKTYRADIEPVNNLGHQVDLYKADITKLSEEVSNIEDLIRRRDFNDYSEEYLKGKLKENQLEIQKIKPLYEATKQEYLKRHSLFSKNEALLYEAKSKKLRQSTIKILSVTGLVLTAALTTAGILLHDNFSLVDEGKNKNQPYAGIQLQPSEVKLLNKIRKIELLLQPLLSKS